VIGRVPWLHLSRKITTVALNIKDPQAEKLAAEVAALTGESKTKAVRVALQERRDRLRLRVVARDRPADFIRFLQEEIWPQVPRHVLGRRLSRKERERILGYGEHGV
jgi:antitoxin VapB